MSIDWEEERQAEEVSEAVYSKCMELTQDMSEAQRRRCYLESATKILEGVTISVRSEVMRDAFQKLMDSTPGGKDGSVKEG
jgi:hypothetical protein